MKVPTEDKLDFVKWVVSKYRFKRRESTWILNYLMGHSDVLRNVVFTTDAHHCPRAMLMSVQGSEDVPFRFYKGELMTADAEKAFHDLRMHSDDLMYIQISFEDIPSEYLSVLENNPHAPSNAEDSELAESFLAHMMEKMGEQRAMEEIDKALDSGDKELFMSLTNNLVKGGV